MLSRPTHRQGNTRIRVLALVFGCSVFAIGLQAKKPVPQKTKAPAYGAKEMQAFLAKHCLPCHTGADAMGGAQLDLIKSKADIVKHRDLAERIVRMVDSGLMPPKGSDRPTANEKKGLHTFIQNTIAAECVIKEPGRVTMRRLNRFEYDNTIRDLTGLDLNLAKDFPSDDVGHGFDNIGDVLSISPLLMEKYLQAAEIASTKLVLVPTSKPQRLTPLYSALNVSPGPENDWILFSTGELFYDFDCRIPGEYTFKVSAYGQQAGPEPTKMQIRLDNNTLKALDVTAKVGKPETYEAKFTLAPGKHRLAVAFVNDFYDPGPPARDRNLIVRSFDLIAPAASYDQLPETHRRIIPSDPSKADKSKLARQALSAFASRAYRRPASADEVDRLMQIADLAWKNGEPFERGIQLGVQAALSSPNFLFRVENNTTGPLNGYELATRLSYFLWSSMPDETLLKLAASGELTKPAVLEAQTRRMLKSPKINALSEAFASQWLNLRKLNTVNVDPGTYQGFDDYLRQSMYTETIKFFNFVVAQDRKVTDFIDGKYTFVNETLAKHYGIPDVVGKDFRMVSLDGTPRAGLLTQASILTLTSNPTRTSPVKRGKWVLEQILNDPPPPPPPGVPDLADSAPNGPEPATIREKLQMHLKNPVCASCHTRMDPIGYSLENFDGVGRWRTSDGKVALETTGEFPDGTKFTGANELRNVLMGKKSQFVHGLSEKMLTFATGRGIDSKDRCFVDDVAKRVEANGLKFSALVTGVVLSEPFRMRSGEKKK